MKLYWRTSGNDFYYLNKYHAERRGGFPLSDNEFLRNRSANARLSNRPVQRDEICDHYSVVEILLAKSEVELAQYQVTDIGKPFREWLIPVGVLVDDATVGVVTIGHPPPKEDRKGRGKRAKSRLH